MTLDFLIRVVGDSLSMPRATEGIAYRQTYAELVRERVQALNRYRSVDLYNRSRGGARIETLWEDFKIDSFAFGGNGGELLVIQSGVVDCAPRPVSRVIRKGIGLLPSGLKTRAIKFLHDNRAALLSKGFVFRETPPQKFAELYATWIAQACAEFKWVYAINVAPTNDLIEGRSPGFGASVRQYNSIIAQVCGASGKSNVRVIDVHQAVLQSAGGVSRYINAKDGHHLTAEGHRLYCDLIFSQMPRDFGLA